MINGSKGIHANLSLARYWVGVILFLENCLNAGAWSVEQQTDQHTDQHTSGKAW